MELSWWLEKRNNADVFVGDGKMYTVVEELSGFMESSVTNSRGHNDRKAKPKK